MLHVNDLQSFKFVRSSVLKKFLGKEEVSIEAAEARVHLTMETMRSMTAKKMEMRARVETEAVVRGVTGHVMCAEVVLAMPASPTRTRTTTEITKMTKIRLVWRIFAAEAFLPILLL